MPVSSTGMACAGDINVCPKCKPAMILAPNDTKDCSSSRPLIRIGLIK